MTEPAFGLYLPQVRVSAADIVEAARVAAGCGMRHLWLIDHFQLPRYGPVPEGWTLASAVALQVPGIRIGHLVLCAGVRHPALLAAMASTLDTLTGGRLDLGLGWGGDPEELHALGLNDDAGPTRRAKLRETVAIVRAVLAGGDVDVTGTHYRVQASFPSPNAVQQPVPITIGGAGSTTMRLVNELADWWNCPSYGRGELARLIPRKGDRARVSVNYSLAFDDAAVARTIGHPMAPVLCGRPDALAAALNADRHLGVELFNVQFVHLDGLHAQIERFMAEVAPGIRS